jgi:hypothetical protein
LKGGGVLKYTEIYDDFVSLMKEKTKYQNTLNSLKDGYISNKTISGRNYSYLQYREDGKLVSEYIKEYNLPEIKAELDERAYILKKIDEVSDRLKKLEDAAKILDRKLHKKLVNIRRYAVMDSMPLEKRQKALAFSRAITALEGIPVSDDTNINLSEWAAGKQSFKDCYSKTLQMLNLTEE